MKGRPSAALGLWVATTLFASVAAPPIHWRLSVFALGCAVLAWSARRWEALAGAALAIGTVPLWLAAEARGGWPLIPVLGGSAVLLIASRPALPRAVAPILLAVAAVEATRQALVAPSLPGAAALALPLLTGGLTAAGAAAGARARPWAVLALGAGGIWNGGVALEALRTPPQGPVAARRAVALGVARSHLDVFSADPRLGLAALSVDPAWGELGVALLPVVGPARLLEVGWQPESASLQAAERLAFAALLDAEGQGGRALRLLRRAGADPAVAWTRDLYARCQGEAVASGAQPPEGVAHLPGKIVLDWDFYQDGTRTLDLHADTSLASLTLELEGHAYRGDPSVLVALDARLTQRVTVPEGQSAIALPGPPLEPGPHRVSIRFDNDRNGPDGDRNVWVRALRAP